MPRPAIRHAARLAMLFVSGLAHGQATFRNVTTADGLGSDSVNAVFAVGCAVCAATQEGVGVSTDGGVTWTTRTIADGLGSTMVWDIDAADGVVYAATSFGGVEQDGGVSISTDQGETWQNFDTATGLSSNIVNSIFVADDGVLYAGVTPGAFTSDGGVGISTDGGKTWSVSTFWTTNGLGSRLVQAVCADDNGVIYPATTFPIACTGEGSNEWTGGLAVSKDGGSTWTNLLIENGLGSNFVTDVVVADGVLFAATQCTQAPGQVPGEGGLTMLTTTCVADFDGDLSVDAGDLARLLSWWDENCKSNPAACIADLDGSGVVDSGDLELLLCLWGECLAAP